MRALVVDDSRAMRMIIGRILKKRGFQFEQAEHGQEALTKLAEMERPDVVLVDWNMPVMNGLEFIRAVRKNPAYRDLVLIMVTTETEHEQMVKAFAAGVNEYIMKPFTQEIFEEKLALLGIEQG